MTRRLVIVAALVVALLAGAVALAAWTPGGSPIAAAASAASAPTPKAGEVLIGAYIDNILGVDPGTNSFEADFYVWMRWTDKKLKPWKTLEFMNLYEAWKLMSWPSVDAPVKQPDGALYYQTHYQGAFASTQNLRAFPFGQQALHIEMEDIRSESNKLSFVTDGDKVAIAPEISLPGYQIGRPTIHAAPFAYATDFGFLDSTVTNDYSRATITIPVSHPVVTNIFKYLVPIFLVMIAAALIFQIPPGLVEGRIGLAITALLTLVAMQWTATDQLPTLAYLTMLDALFLLSLAFVLGSLVTALRISWVAREANEQRAIRLDERAMRIFLVAYAAAFAAVLAYYLLT